MDSPIENKYWVVEYLNGEHIHDFLSLAEAKNYSQQLALKEKRMVRIRTVVSDQPYSVKALIGVKALVEARKNEKENQTAVDSRANPNSFEDSAKKKREYLGPQRKNTTIVFTSLQIEENEKDKKKSTRVLVPPGEPKFQTIQRAAQRLWGTHCRVYKNGGNTYTIKPDGPSFRAEVEIL